MKIGKLIANLEGGSVSGKKGGDDDSASGKKGKSTPSPTPVPTPAPAPACQLSVNIGCQIDSNATCTPLPQRDEDCFVQLAYSVEICNDAMSSAPISQYDVQITPGISASLGLDPIPGNDCATPFIPNAQIDACNANATSEVIVFVQSDDFCPGGVSATLVVEVGGL
jgi:hypothetical protein